MLKKHPENRNYLNLSTRDVKNNFEIKQKIMILKTSLALHANIKIVFLAKYAMHVCVCVMWRCSTIPARRQPYLYIHVRLTAVKPNLYHVYYVYHIHHICEL